MACLLLAATASWGLAGPLGAATLRIAVDGVLPGRGPILVSLCRGGLDPLNCLTGASREGTAARVIVDFSDVTPGIYAVAAFQDLTGNAALDRSRNGLPLEPFAFSIGAGRTGAPRFERAALRIIGDSVVELHLTAIAGPRAEPQ